MKSFSVGTRAIALMVCMLIAPSVVRANAIETWSNGTSTEGWGSHSSNLFNDNSGIGGNPGGWLRGVRGANPIFQMNGSGGIFNGNYGTLFGPQLTVGYDAYVEDGGFSGIRLTLRNTASTTDWRYDWDLSADPQVKADGWVHFSAPIDASWTDAQAVANGWILAAGSGSWASAVADVSSGSYLVLLTGGAALPTGSAYALGIDNFAVTAVPEPSVVILIGTGIISCVAYASRRKHRIHKN